MRLLELSIRNFRGFGPAHDTVRLDGDLTLFFGPNGFGKTSLAESIEWLFYGATKRRQRGDTYSRTEYANCYGNVHGRTPVEVEAVVEFGGSEIRLCRRLAANETSVTFIDGTQAPFSSLNIKPIEAVYPVVAQHGLQTFVHSKPKDRRDAICAALGLDELTSLKTALDSARTSLQRSPPSVVAAARSELAAQTPVLARIPVTAAVATRWRQTPVQVDEVGDIESLLKAAENLTGKDCSTPQAALAPLRELRRTASRAVFDTEPLEPAEDPRAAVAAFLEAAEKIVLPFAHLERAIAALAAAMVAAYSRALLDFWKTGLELAPEGDHCPMCEAPTLDLARREELRRRLSSGAAILESGKAVTQAVGATKTELAALRLALDNLGAPGIGASQKEHLTRLVTDAPTELEAFIAKHDAFSTALATVDNATKAAEEFLTGCVQRLTVPENVPEVVASAATVRDTLTRDAAALLDPYGQYVGQWNSFRTLLSDRIASNDLVSRIDAVGKSIGFQKHITVLSRYAKALTESQTLIRAVERHILAKQTTLLTSRGGEVKAYYRRLNSTIDVGFDDMEPGNDSMKLHAVSYGRRMSAAANLSECQLNCLGLAVWLMRANTPSSPFGFILLDDPVQSMDDPHNEAFITDMVPHLLDDHGKQIIILSHSSALIDRLRNLNQHRQTRVYHFDEYGVSGPTLVEQAGLAVLLGDIKASSRSNERNRKYAVDRIRVLCEQFIRELHLKVMNAPAPAQYNRAMASLLLPLFRNITGTTQQEYVGLKDTIEFADPAHHTQVGYTVPVRTQIDPHINRLEQLMKKYLLI